MDALSWLEIDLTRLDANVRVIRTMVGSAEGGARICAAVKADGYGLGARTIASRLAGAGVDMLAVYNPDEARLLLRQGAGCGVLILAPLRDLQRTDPLYRAAATGRLHLGLYDLEQIGQLQHAARQLAVRLDLHLYLDTGMCRGGVVPRDLPRALDQLRDARQLRLAGIWTHLACADSDIDNAAAQVERFDQALHDMRDRMPEGVAIHLANTFATLRRPAWRRDMVRVGLGLLGYGPELLPHDDQPAEAWDLQPIVRWCTRIHHLGQRLEGERVGYNGACTLTRDSLLGIAPVGYGDGYPLALSGKAQVMLPDAGPNGGPIAAPILGRVNMDQVVIDLTDAPGAKVGSLVEMITPDRDAPNALHRLAELADSHCYEMLTRLSPRVPRLFKRDHHAEPVEDASR